MKKVLSLLLVLAVWASQVACSASELEADIDNLVARAEQLAPLAAGVLSLVDPALAPLVAPAEALLVKDGASINTLIAGLKAPPNATVLQEINAAVADAQQNIATIVSLAQVKDPADASKVEAWAQLMGAFFSDAAAFVVNNSPASAELLPAVFGFHIPGVDLMAVTSISATPQGEQVPGKTVQSTVSTTHVQKHAVKSGYTARSVAEKWNAIAGAKGPHLTAPRRHLLGFIPVPFTAVK